LNQERNAVQLQGARLMTSVNLIKALGCGWQSPAEVLQVPAK
jgi:outer membrane protein TolC